MRISEAVARSGLSADTIRYYEKCDMLPDIKRGSNGHRIFSTRNVEWLTLLYWLRETGMPTKDMRQFTSLAKAGRKTICERRSILLQHAEELKKRREKINKCEAVLKIKIASYQ